jgi:mono/diheme cytochrome c family protein
MARFLLRIAGAATLNAATYEDVEADVSATPQAMVVILAASLAAGIGASGWRSELTDVLVLSASAAAIALVAWMCWAVVTFEIGARMLADPATHSDVGELLRTLGFSAAPGLFFVFGAFPGLTTSVFIITCVWMLAAMVIALRQALDYNSVFKALAVCSLGWLLALGLIVLFGLFSDPLLSAQSASKPDGAQLFRNHCASCHGAAGRGDGPMAALMRKPPADLTKFALNNGGVFPVERLRRIIDGRDVPSHGDRDMPVWGIALRTSRDGGGADTVSARIDALVQYIQSLQERRAQ